MSLSEESLGNYYKTNFFLRHKYNYSLTELEEMMPWERDVYISLLEQELEKDLNKE
jgi:hypothetical protein